ncbi:MAG: hypothetical protein C0473_01920 [Cyanobacteria bacterium DS3.002]|nr:hypothetical protein [Cyanobacteria bacterium DS3.002]MBA4049680.1 hypothetical protein [Cyanobacteria bacterium DS2.008]MBA4073798.1 hypothetical protein [Cyanobacteria bacterium PR.023]
MHKQNCHLVYTGATSLSGLVLVEEVSMVGTSYKARLEVLKESLLAVPPGKLVDILMERVVYDQSLWTYLNGMAKAEAPETGVLELFEMAKKVITRAYGDNTLDYKDARYHLPEIYSAQSIVEQIFEKGHYQQVIDLFDWSLQYEEEMASPSWPDDFMDLAYMPLAAICLRSHLRLGKTPKEVAEIYNKMSDDDKYGMFCHLHYLEPKDEAELAPVMKILDQPRR